MKRSQPREALPRKIGDAAQVLGVTTRTLRFYEEQGIIKPLRTEKGNRVYGEEDIERARIVQLLSGLGISLRDVSALTSARPESKTGDEASHKVKVLLEDLQSDIEQRKKDCDATLQQIHSAIALVEQCFGCRRLPTNKDCSSCPVAKDVGHVRLLQLIWDQADR